MLHAGSGFGIHREVSLETTGAVCVREVLVRGDPRSGEAKVVVETDSAVDEQLAFDVQILPENFEGRSFGAGAVRRVPRGTDRWVATVPMPGARLWQPGDPCLYRCRVMVRGGVRDLKKTSCGEAISAAFCAGGTPAPQDVLGPLRAVFLNYLLDALPVAVLRMKDGATSELCVRTCLARGVELARHTNLTVEQLAARAVSTDRTERAALVDLFGIFVSEYDFRPVDLSKLPYADLLAEHAGTRDGCLVHNYGALRCLEQLAKLLDEQGFILILHFPKKR
jgi:hypothetical protein